ncbi:MAG: hypothetical protein GF308_12285 [Candidatus Heimdallarchaeota archaeon]|nr:hypothetical protein [Candidatus Heimdallarchaeota archaeon]
MTAPFCSTFPVKEINSAIDLDAVILGAPFEDDVEFYPRGTTFAPKAIREASHFFSGQSLSKTTIHHYNVLDLGDIETNCSRETFLQLLASKVVNIMNKSALPIILGGDHSIALGTTNGLFNSKKTIEGIVWIDAHLDLMDKYPEDKQFTRATVLRRIIDLGLIDPLNIFFIGCRGHNLGIEEIEFAEQNNMNWLSAQEMRSKRRLEQFLTEILTEHKNLYLSLDMDVLDPAFAPGVSVPEPGGITSRDLFEIIKRLAPVTSCLEIVEVNPKLDINRLTAMTACKVIFELMDSL